MNEGGAELSAADVELFERAKQVLIAAHDPVIHQVAAALRTESGQIYTGLHIGSRRVNVCAESSAIANAEMAGDRGISAIVAVCKDEQGRIVVTNPCGLCRELMTQYGPQAEVLIDYRGSVRKVPAGALMPNPWMFPYENDWTVSEPSAKDDA